MNSIPLQSILSFIISLWGTIFIANKFKLPYVPLFLVAGLTIGPTALGVLEKQEYAEELMNMGVTFFLFLIGIAIPVKREDLHYRNVLFASIYLLLVFLLATLLFLQFYNHFLTAFSLAGLVLLLSLVPVFRYKSGDKSEKEGMSRAVILLQVLFLVVLFPNLSISSAAQFPVGYIGKVVLLIVILSGHLLIVWLLGKKSYSFHNKRVPFVILLSSSVGFIWLYSLIGIPYGLGAFMAGIGIASANLQEQAIIQLKDFGEFALGAFMMPLGMLLPFSFLLSNLLAVLTAVALVLVFSLLVGRLAKKTLPASNQIQLSRFQMYHMGGLAILLAVALHEIGSLTENQYFFFLSGYITFLLLSAFLPRFGAKGKS